MISFVSGVVFANVRDSGCLVRPLEMDILMPCDKAQHPAILYINGGGFINANKDGYIQQRMDLAEHGYVVASMTYRVAPNSTFPAPLLDVKSAIRFLRAHADTFHIDKGRIGVMGGSSGGYLSAMAGVTNGMKDFDAGDFLDESSDVQAVADLYGLSDLSRIGADFSEEVQALHRSSGATQALLLNGTGVFGGIDGGIAANPEGVRASNPMTYISDKTPPFLLMHGEDDPLVSPSQTEILRAALEDHGIDAVRYVLKGAAHGGREWVQPEVMKIVIDFFDKNLK